MIPADPQHKYQVRFDVGLVGFQALAGQADVVILADALPPTGYAPGIATPLTAHRVIAADLGTAARVAAWALARQAEKGDRLLVAVIAVGERRNDGTARFAVEDFLVAGAVIEALAGLGIDHVSPEAAAAAASFTGLRQALRHLVSASETALALVADGRQAEVTAAVQTPAMPGAEPAGAEPAGAGRESAEIVLLREFTFPV